MRSDGVTVNMKTLLAGAVRDGSMFGVDLNYQSDLTTLSANWDGFGYDRLEGQEIDAALSGEKEIFLCLI